MTYPPFSNEGRLPDFLRSPAWDPGEVLGEPVFELVLVSMGRSCQERARGVLNDFAAVGTFLLNCGEAVSRWPGSCLGLTSGLMYRHCWLCAPVNSGPSQPPQSPTGREQRCLSTATNETAYRCSHRTMLGDAPVIRRKCLARWLWSENPADSAISDIGRSVLRSICWACSMRRCST